MKPRELSAWVAENWPAARDNPKTTEMVLRATAALLTGKMRRRYPWADPDEIRSTIQLGAWRALLAFDPAKGAYFPYAHQYAWRMCASMAVEMRVPLVWDRASNCRPVLGLTVRNSSAWYDRERQGELSHLSLDAVLRDDGALETRHDVLASPSPSPDDWLVVNERLTALEDALRFFPITVRDRWRTFVLNGTTERELAQSLGISRQRVTQLKAEWRQYQAGDASVKTRFLERNIATTRRYASQTRTDLSAVLHDFRTSIAQLCAEVSPPVRRSALPARQFSKIAALAETGMTHQAIASQLQVSRYVVARALKSVADGQTRRKQLLERPQIEKIVALATAGHRLCSIAREMQVSRFVVARALKTQIALNLARAANDPK